MSAGKSFLRRLTALEAKGRVLLDSLSCDSIHRMLTVTKPGDQVTITDRLKADRLAIVSTCSSEKPQPPA